MVKIIILSRNIIGMSIELIVHYYTSEGIVHFDTGAEGDYLLASLVRKTSHELKIFLRTSFEPYFIPREPNNHIKVMILRLEWYKVDFPLV